MVFFRSKKSRQIIAEPLPDWDDTRWRSHLRTNALGTEYQCGIYVQRINDDRKEAARLLKNNDNDRARNYAESALRHNRTVTALAALSPLSNALYQRAEPLGGYTSLVQVPEPARSGIVTIIFAAGRMRMNFLSEIVQFLQEQFGPVHIEAIQKGEGELYALVNPTVRDALSPAPATPEDIDMELASAVKQYFGITVPAAQPRSQRSKTVAVPEIVPGAASSSDLHVSPNDVRRSQTTPVSALSSSDIGAPLSPRISSDTRQVDEVRRAPPARSRMYAPNNSSARYGSTVPGGAYHGEENEVPQSEPLPGSAADVGRTERKSVAQMATQLVDEGRETIPSAKGGSEVGKDDGKELERGQLQEDYRRPEHLRGYKDSDDMLLARYDHLCTIIST